MNSQSHAIKSFTRDECRRHLSAPVELDLGLMDIVKQRRYIAKIQDGCSRILCQSLTRIITLSDI